MDAWQDVAADAAEVGADDHTVEAVHRCPYHMPKEQSWSLMFREEHNKDNAPPAKCIQTNKVVHEPERVLHVQL